MPESQFNLFLEDCNQLRQYRITAIPFLKVNFNGDDYDFINTFR